MKRLLLLGGVLNACGVVIHLLLARSISLSTRIDSATAALLHALNVGAILLGAFLCVASIRYRHELLTTRLGRAVLVLAVLVFTTRAIEEPLLFSGSPVLLAFCIVAALVYGFPLVAGRHGAPSAPASYDQ
jgi:hypothetical protein